MLLEAGAVHAQYDEDQETVLSATALACSYHDV